MTSAVNPDQNPDSYGFTTEIGHADNVRIGWSRFRNRQILEAADNDVNPELTFPESVPVYRQMSTTDGQVGSIIRAITNALLKAEWTLDDSGVRAEVTKFTRDNLGLPVPGAALSRNRASRVVWRKHLKEALSSLVYGFAVFEQTYTVVPGVDGESFRVWLRKLSARGQSTVTRIEVDEGGGLVAVYQRAALPLLPPYAGGTAGLNELVLPAPRVVVYVNDQEGGNFYGTSMLRTAYKHWRVNDVLLRLAAQIIERNGMGIPGMEYDGTVVTKADAELAVAEWRSGATAGIVYPKGAMPVLKGVEGTTPDPLPLMNYNDEAIGRSVLAMFLNLGHDSGARSLGQTFLDAFTASLQAVADFVGDVATQYVVRDLVELNWGPDEAYPTVTSGSLAKQELISAADLKLLVDGGLIKVGEPTSVWVRDSFGLPPDDADAAKPPPPPAVPAAFGPVLPGAEPPGPAPGAVPAAVPAVAAAALDELDRRVQAYVLAARR